MAIIVISNGPWAISDDSFRKNTLIQQPVQTEKYLSSFNCSDNFIITAGTTIIFYKPLTR